MANCSEKSSLVLPFRVFFGAIVNLVLSHRFFWNFNSIRSNAQRWPDTIATNSLVNSRKMSSLSRGTTLNHLSTRWVCCRAHVAPDRSATHADLVPSTSLRFSLTRLIN